MTDINFTLQEFVSPMDYIGFVRSVATFEGIDRPECMYDLEEWFGAVWEDEHDGHTVHTVTGGLSKLFYFSPLQLWHTAAHEIGHILCGHTKRSLRNTILYKILDRVYKKVEDEANKWAEKYAFKHPWRTSYKGWGFV